MVRPFYGQPQHESEERQHQRVASRPACYDLVYAAIEPMRLAAFVCNHTAAYVFCGLNGGCGEFILQKGTARALCLDEAAGFGES